MARLLEIIIDADIGIKIKRQISQKTDFIMIHAAPTMGINIILTAFRNPSDFDIREAIFGENE